MHYCSYTYLYFVDVVGLPYIKARDTEGSEILPNRRGDFVVQREQHRSPLGPFPVDGCFPHSLLEVQCETDGGFRHHLS